MRIKTIPKTHCFTEKDLHLFELPQVFTASSFWFESGMSKYVATFDLVVRKMPKNRNFLLMGGTEEIVKEILNWRYTKSEIQYLLANKIITSGFAKYLQRFRFTGDLYALPEGTVFFPGEPVVRITAPLIEANLLTMFLTNAFTSNTIFLSKVVRGVIAAKDKKFLAQASLRAQSHESAFKFGRAVYISGGYGANTIPSFCRKYNLPFILASLKAYHAVIKSFPTEIEAMRKIAELFPNMIDLMVDTYDFKKGMRNAIIVATELKKKGNLIKGITIDSGDLYERSVKARKLLDRAGLNNVTITVASNLDEWEIMSLLARNAPVDKFMVITEMISSCDAPSLEAVYKLSELQSGNIVMPQAKLTSGKISYPGKKQLFRVYENGKMQKDIVGLETESLGIPLLKKIIGKGKLVFNLPALDEIRNYVQKQLTELPPRLLSIKGYYSYRVEKSDNLKLLMQGCRKRHR